MGVITQNGQSILAIKVKEDKRMSLSFLIHVYTTALSVALKDFWYLDHAFLVFGSCFFGIWIMPFWYLTHAFWGFGSCLFGIWLMPFWDLAHAIMIIFRTSEGIL